MSIPGQLTDIFKIVKNKGLDFKEAVVPDVSGGKNHIKFDMKQVDESHKINIHYKKFPKLSTEYNINVVPD